jgi:hypothetical protein
VNNLKDEEFQYLTDSVNMRTWSCYSLAWRTKLFHRKFPDRWLSLGTLRNIYAKSRQKKKAILTRRAANRKTQRLDEFDDMIVNLYKYFSGVRERSAEEGSHVIYLDECVFSARGY